MTQALLFVARLALGGIFVVSGVWKLVNPQGFVNVLEAAGVPLPVVAGWLGMLLEVVAPILVVIGWQARWAAWALVVFIGAASVIGHPFWTHEGKAVMMHQIHFLKNIAIMGGLIAVAFHGQSGTLRALFQGPPK
jgi:putative oxidoreductase